MKSFSLQCSETDKLNLGTTLAVVVAQLAERLLLTPEVYSSNPAIDKIYIDDSFTANFIEKTKINKKWTRMAH